MGYKKEFAGLCLRKSWHHKLDMWDALSAAVSSGAAFVLWMWPHWFQPQTVTDMNSMSGWFYTSIALAFLVLWRLFMSPFWVYHDLKSRAAKDLAEEKKAADEASSRAQERESILAKELESLKSQKIDARDRLLLDCADRLKSGESFLQALQNTKADEFPEEDIHYVCSVLESRGHISPFNEKGAIGKFSVVGCQRILADMRLKGVGHDPRVVHEYLLDLHLSRL